MTSPRPLCAFLVATFAIAQVAHASPNPTADSVRRDRTGISWVFPFRQAKARARADGRLLFVKPLPFGSDAEGGWDPISEVMRAGPLSDERVIALLNRRFVPVYFDLSPRGAAGDKDARAFVVDARWKLRKQAVGAPPTLIMTVDGRVLKEIDNFTTANDLLRMLTVLLETHPQFSKPTAIESRIRDYKQRAQVAMDLQQYGVALKALSSRAAPAARLLRAKIYRHQGALTSMERELKRIRTKSLRDDVRMERGRLLFAKNDMPGVLETLKAFPATHARYSEALYYQGLAWFHRGRWERALEVWKHAIERGPEGPWIYRADWAYTEAKQGKKSRFTDHETRVSVLNRIGYVSHKGHSHPDLVPRS